MNMVRRYDIAAARNVLTALHKFSPRDYARLMGQLQAQTGMAGLGDATTTDPQTQPTGFWDKLLSAGSNVLTTIANYKIQEATNQADAQQKQQEYDAAVATEMKRQAALAAQAQTQALQTQNQLDYLKQQQQLNAAAAAAKGKLQLSFGLVGGLVLLWIGLKVTHVV